MLIPIEYLAQALRPDDGGGSASSSAAVGRGPSPPPKRAGASPRSASVAGESETSSVVPRPPWLKATADFTLHFVQGTPPPELTPHRSPGGWVHPPQCTCGRPTCPCPASEMESGSPNARVRGAAACVTSHGYWWVPLCGKDLASQQRC